MHAYPGSHHNMPTDSAVDTHINIHLSTMMFIEATNYTGAISINQSINQSSLFPDQHVQK